MWFVDATAHVQLTASACYMYSEFAHGLLVRCCHAIQSQVQLQHIHARLAEESKLPQDQVEQLVKTTIEPRQFGFLGEPRVNVLELNLALDSMAAAHK